MHRSIGAKDTTINTCIYSSHVICSTCIDKVKGKSSNELRIYYKHLRLLSHDGGKLEVCIETLIDKYVYQSVLPFLS